MLFALALVSHLVFGLTPSTHVQVEQNGTIIDTLLVSESGVVGFEAESGGDFQIVPVGNVPIPPLDCPDLYPTGVRANAPCGDGEWIVYFKVGNQGRADSGPFTTRVSLTPPGGVRSTKCNLETPGLAVGATTAEMSCRMATSVPSTPIGDWIVTIQVDVGNAIGESNETNNEW